MIMITNNNGNNDNEQGGKKSKDNDWNQTGQNLKINNSDPTPLTHLPSCHATSFWILLKNSYINERHTTTLDIEIKQKN